MALIPGYYFSPWKDDPMHYYTYIGISVEILSPCIYRHLSGAYSGLHIMIVSLMFEMIYSGTSDKGLPVLSKQYIKPLY